jgi:hypothetical protein
MEKNQKLLFLKDKDLTKDPLSFRRIRVNTINALSPLGAKVRHDSGGRLIIIEIPEEAEETLAKNIPTVQVVPITEDMKVEIPDLNPDELLFLEALKKRYSKKFRDDKKKRKPGESPEEKQLFSAPCIRDQY